MRTSFGPSLDPPTADLADCRTLEADFSSWSILPCSWTKSALIRSPPARET